MTEEMELAILLAPKNFAVMAPREQDFWRARARIALDYRSDSFWRRLWPTIVAPFRRVSGVAGRMAGGAGGDARHKVMVRLHPLPEGASPLLASVIGAAVAGALRECLRAHPLPLDKNQRGTLIGSTRKRAVNQLVCREGVTRIRRALES